MILLYVKLLVLIHLLVIAHSNAASVNIMQLPGAGCSFWCYDALDWFLLYSTSTADYGMVCFDNVSNVFHSSEFVSFLDKTVRYVALLFGFRPFLALEVWYKRHDLEPTSS